MPLVSSLQSFPPWSAAVKRQGGTDEDIHRLATPDGEELIEKIAQLIVQANRSFGELPIWRTIRIGTHRTVDELCSMLESAGFRVSDWANNVLTKVTLRPTETELDLVIMSVAELGFKDGARRDVIYQRVQELGLQLCPAEVGPVLRLAYTNQPGGEWLLIGMEPIADADGDLEVFDVEHDDRGRWLYSLDGDPDYFWYGRVRWVFVRPRK